MEDWVLFWKIVLILCLISYFSLAIVVAIGGFLNIKDFLKDILLPDDD